MSITTMTGGPRHLRVDESPAPLPEAEPAATALLSADDEVTLARRVEAGMLAAERLRARSWSCRTERSALRLLVREGEEARERLVVANLRLVHHWARRTPRGGLEYGDLVQHGMLGLIHAVEKFDFRLGNKFSTYATWWIRQAMGRAPAAEGRTIRVPVHAYEEAKAVRGALRTAALGWDEAVASPHLVPGDWTLIQIERARRSLRPVLSLDLIAESDADLVDPDDDFAAEIDGAIGRRAEATALLDAVERSLGWRTAEVLRMRHGFVGDPCTLEEVGQRFGVTRERIRQVEKKGLDLLRELASTGASE